MHQDQRIGLALGVLLIGACAAFFFRNETRSAQHPPRLQHAQQLDQRIAEKSTRPYLKGVEAIEAADRKRSEFSTEPSRSFWSKLNARSMMTTPDPVQRDRKPASSRRQDDDVWEVAPITVPVDESAGQDRVPTPSVEIATQPAVTVPQQDDTYIVQKGETLTSIAARMLGNPSRYPELFEANTDQLVDPNDVKPGMVLRIPSQQTAQAAKPRMLRSQPTLDLEESTSEQIVTVPEPATDIVTTPAERDLTPRIEAAPSTPFFSPPSNANEIDRASEAPSSEDVTAPKRFVPVPRNPIFGRPADAEANSRTKRNVNGRRLTQAKSDLAPSRIAR